MNETKKQGENKMSKFGNTLTHESISFEDWDNFGNCFANWFQPVGHGQEIDNYYKDGEISLHDIASMIISLRDMTCGQGCDKPLLELLKTRTFTVERARFWDNEGGTNDVTVLGKITFSRRTDTVVGYEVEVINESRR